MKPFHQILGNNLVANITNFTVWFAVTFWVYLETRSVFATGMIAGVYLVFTAGFGFWFGSIVDHNPKKLAMLGSSVASLAFYAASLAMVLFEPENAFTNPYGPYLWVFILLVMAVILLETAVGGGIVLWVTGIHGHVRRGFFLLTGAILALCAVGAWALTRAAFMTVSRPLRTKAMRAVLVERFAQAWLVPRWISTSPARKSFSPVSITA
jgi:hypothetical protein